MAKTTTDSKTKTRARGKLKIGDDWNAITIIALSQSNPLKAIAELVENSIDAKARIITITRGREHGRHFLAIRDDGEGVPRDGEGRPDFHYVATHICDSIKRQLKVGGAAGLQGEFGIGLLSFWTLGEEVTMTSTGADHRAWQMIMRKGDPSYTVTARRTLFGEAGTEIRIAPLLDGIRSFSGEKIQWYLAAELRDRIRSTGVKITVVDRLARKQYSVEPRQYEGRLLHQLPNIRTPLGDIYAELYLNEPSDANAVALFRNGSRVIEDVALLGDFSHPPWTLGCLQGHLDAPFVSLTPGTRTGLVLDASYTALSNALLELEPQLIEVIESQRRAEEERASRDQLRTIQRAFREALLALPAEEYDWFDIQVRGSRPAPGGPDGHRAGSPSDADIESSGDEEPAFPVNAESKVDKQRQFFEFAGPLFSVAISPASSVLRIGTGREFRAMPRDRSRRRVEQDLEFHWEILEGVGVLDGVHNQAVLFKSSDEPGLVRLKVSVRQRDVVCEAEALITLTHEILTKIGTSSISAQGLPGYTFERAPGESWRSKFDAVRHVIVVNNGHRDFVYASRNKSLKLRYLVRLFAKELVLRNFPGLPADQLLERMVELSLRTEEHL